MKPGLAYFKKNRIKVSVILVILLIFVGILFFIKHNYFLYKETIVKVTAVSETKIISEGEQVEPVYEQQVQGIIMNGKYKNKRVTFKNERTYSGIEIYEHYVRKGDEVFVNLEDGGSVNSIIDFKRDFIITLELLMLCFILILVASKKSIFIFISTIINILIFALILFLRVKSINIFLLFCFGSILFTTLTLLIIGGFNKKTICAIISTLFSILIMMLIALICFKIYKGDIHYEFIEFAEYFYDFESVFYSGILISGLGAIMDIAMIISSAINELIRKNPQISLRELKDSAWIIAGDIMGTQMNVLFFSCIVGALPLVIFLARNGNGISFTFKYYGFAEIIRALVGAIGIALAVPLTYLVNIALRKKVKVCS